MRKLLASLMVVLFVMSLTACAYCDSKENGPMRKLGRGGSNCVTFPCEIPNRMNIATKRFGSAMGLGYGFFEGIAMMVFRLGLGMYEVATFPIPNPEGYGPILDDPEFFTMQSSNDKGPDNEEDASGAANSAKTVEK